MAIAVLNVNILNLENTFGALFLKKQNEHSPICITKMMKAIRPSVMVKITIAKPIEVKKSANPNFSDLQHMYSAITVEAMNEYKFGFLNPSEYLNVSCSNVILFVINPINDSVPAKTRAMTDDSKIISSAVFQGSLLG